MPRAAKEERQAHNSLTASLHNMVQVRAQSAESEQERERERKKRERDQEILFNFCLTYQGCVRVNKLPFACDLDICYVL